MILMQRNDLREKCCVISMKYVSNSNSINHLSIFSSPFIAESGIMDLGFLDIPTNVSIRSKKQKE